MASALPIIAVFFVKLFIYIVPFLLGRGGSTRPGSIDALHVVLWSYSGTRKYRSVMW